jgi:hypothetical protein
LPFPSPVPGLVIRYSYLWRENHLRGEREGRKDRPCAAILATVSESGDRIVTVLPITHSVPAHPQQAIEIPLATKQRLKLDSDRSWIVLSEANRFIWPGPDLRLASQADAASVAYGNLPHALYDKVRLAFIETLKERHARVVSRSS